MPSALVLDYFRRSWAGLLLDDPVYVVKDVPSRSVKPDLEDSLFGGTLATDSTIRHCVALHRRSPIGADLGEVLVLASLGDALNGHAQIVHGGFSAMLIDETAGLVNSSYGDAPTFTARLEINYRKPVPDCSVVLCRARLTKVEGRKRSVKCTLEGPSNVIYAESDSLFLEFKESHKL